MSLVDETKQIYWQSTVETFCVRAWYPGGRTDYKDTPLADGTCTWISNHVQSSKEALAKDDFLYAYKAIGFYPTAENNNELKFKHLMSKIVINLVNSAYLKDKNVFVTLMTNNPDSRWDYVGEFKYDSNDEFVLEYVEGPDQKYEDITPCQLDTPNKIEPNGNTAYVSYEALVIPQDIANAGKYIQIKVGETTYYKWELPSDVPSLSSLKSGYQYTFNITVDAKGLNVTINSNSIGWDTTTGNTGQGSVEIP